MKRKKEIQMHKNLLIHMGIYIKLKLTHYPPKKPEEFRNMVINNIDKYFNEDIYQQELSKYTPEKIRELVNTSVGGEFNTD